MTHRPQLPPDYLQLIARLAEVLRLVAARLRAKAEHSADAPELWLSIRDYEGLGERLAGVTDWEFNNDSLHLMITGQDIGVLDELVATGRKAPALLTDVQFALLTRAVAFLRDYLC